MPRTASTFKVSPADFPADMRRLQALGELKSQHIAAGDVTERVAGIENRIITARTFDLRSTRDDMRHEVRYALRGGGSNDFTGPVPPDRIAPSAR